VDIWVKHATRQRDCVLCTVRIMPGDEVLIGQFKRTYPWGTRTKQTASHFECWISKARTYLADNPYNPKFTAGPGRPVVYSQDDIRLRKNLQVNITRWGKKQREFVGQGMWAMADRYGAKIAKARMNLDTMTEACKSSE